MVPRLTAHSLLAAATLAAAASSTFAADPAPAAPAPADSSKLSLSPFQNILTQDTLTGDWGGTRKQLADKGLTFDLSLVQVYQGVLNGSGDKGWNYGGRENVSVNLDTGKMGMWPGGFLFIEGEGNYGEFVGARQTSSLLPADNNAVFPETDGPQFDLPAFQYTQFLCKEFGAFVGKLDTIVNGDVNEFAHGKGGEGFLNTAFCFNPLLAVTVPYSALGTGFILLPTGDPNEFIVTGSVLDTEGRPDTSGFDTVFKGGTTYAGNARYTTHFFGLKGHQSLGATYSDRLYTSLDNRLGNLIIPGLPIQTSSGSWSASYNADQYLFQPDPKTDEGFGVFARVGTSDAVANPMHWFLSGGLGGRGLIPGRKLDRWGVGYYYIVGTNGQLPKELRFNDSQGGELFYEIALTPWARLTPDLQILQPSQQNQSVATVLGIRLEMKF